MVTFSALDRVDDPALQLRLDLLAGRVAVLRDVLDQDKTATEGLTKLVTQTRTSLGDLVGIAARAAAEILLEVGDIHRFT